MCINPNTDIYFTKQTKFVANRVLLTICFCSMFRESGVIERYGILFCDVYGLCFCVVYQ